MVGVRLQGRLAESVTELAALPQHMQMEGHMDEQVEARKPRTAVALLFVLLAMPLAPVGSSVRQVVAHVTDGSDLPCLLISLDPVSDAVTATPTAFRVDESGAAACSVPLFTMPSTAGVAP